MQPAALPAEHLVGDRLAHQRVPERELVLAGLDQDAPGDQVAQHGDELVLARTGHIGEQVERDAVAEHGGRLDDAVADRVEVVDLAA